MKFYTAPSKSTAITKDTFTRLLHLQNKCLPKIFCVVNIIVCGRILSKSIFCYLPSRKICPALLRLFWEMFRLFQLHQRHHEDEQSPVRALNKTLCHAENRLFQIRRVTDASRLSGNRSTLANFQRKCSDIWFGRTGKVSNIVFCSRAETTDGSLSIFRSAAGLNLLH